MTGQWRLERHRNPMSWAITWVVVRTIKGRFEYLTNEAGRIKRFRSEEAANDALARMEVTP